MATISQTPTPERGTRIIIPTFTDETGEVISLGSLSSPVWYLTTKRKNRVVNGRYRIPLTALYITLTNDDLAITDDDLWRVVTVETLYNSATYGNGLKLRAQYEFPLEDLPNVEPPVGTIEISVTNNLVIGEAVTVA
jgi:hypothetical protein